MHGRSQQGRPLHPLQLPLLIAAGHAPAGTVAPAAVVCCRLCCCQEQQEGVWAWPLLLEHAQAPRLLQECLAAHLPPVSWTCGRQGGVMWQLCFVAPPTAYRTVEPWRLYWNAEGPGICSAGSTQTCGCKEWPTQFPFPSPKWWRPSQPTCALQAADCHHHPPLRALCPPAHI